MAARSDILYPRYTDISQILLEPSAEAGAQKAGRGAAVQNGSHAIAPQQSTPSSNGTAAGVEAAAEPEAAAESQQKKASQKRVSGTGNAEEAEQIRKRLGISSNKPTSACAQTTFSFNFAVQNGGAEERPTDDDNDAEPGAAAQDQINGTHGQQAAEEDPALAERLARVMGETSGRSIERRVFVGGMPFSYEEEDVREYWGYCGQIESLDLMRFPDTGRFKGIAFITFATQEGYETALQCDGEWLDSTQIRVERCKSAGAPPKRKRESGAEDRRRPDKRHSGTAPKVPGYNVAYVGNIAFEAGESDLRELLGECTITKVRLHTDKATGKFKGYAHIHFADEDSLDRAVAYDDTSLKGRQLKIGYAQEKKQT